MIRSSMLQDFSSGRAWEVTSRLSTLRAMFCCCACVAPRWLRGHVLGLCANRGAVQSRGDGSRLGPDLERVALNANLAMACGTAREGIRRSRGAACAFWAPLCYTDLLGGMERRSY